MDINRVVRLILYFIILYYTVCKNLLRLRGKLEEFHWIYCFNFD